jgi:EAL and modified HD-GYP domain-containing signal transduction protein
LRLFSELNDEDVFIEQIEEFILQIPKLSYRILRLANSAAAYRGKKIDTLLDAIQKLGLQQIRDWLSLFLLSSQNDVAPDLLERTLIRAKMCEYLARHSEHSDPHQAYTVGILSTLDMFLNEPMESLLAKIQLNDALKDAILYHQGKTGIILQDTINYENADFTQLEHTRYEKQDLIQAYLEGITYANSIMSLM